MAPSSPASFSVLELVAGTPLATFGLSSSPSDAEFDFEHSMSSFTSERPFDANGDEDFALPCLSEVPLSCFAGLPEPLRSQFHKQLNAVLPNVPICHRQTWQYFMALGGLYGVQPDQWQALVTDEEAYLKAFINAIDPDFFGLDEEGFNLLYPENCQQPIIERVFPHLTPNLPSWDAAESPVVPEEDCVMADV
ncbi:hypothetical protein K488DRAFT_83762 [Vararia minispora EC-137]|uniref:Uncharacterized protein n=1 Tax=Vararia minispora EC-137 TaxID=1314806 RepID=A0ACB8QSN7_9AGAM|nr:hypothetical protein K488DRAFT_83762 [Vararia minispora EC-137]